jgi:predicted phosphohydrolase
LNFSCFDQSCDACRRRISTLRHVRYVVRGSHDYWQRIR